jgi:hypothetical protein
LPPILHPEKANYVKLVYELEKTIGRAKNHGQFELDGGGMLYELAVSGNEVSVVKLSRVLFDILVQKLEEF